MLAANACWGQGVNVQGLYVLAQDSESVWSTHELNFPFVTLADKPIQNKINQLLLEEVFDAGGIDVTDTNNIKLAIDTQAIGAISGLTFEVLLNSGSLLQIDISEFGVGPFAYGWTHKLLINTQTAHRYALIDLIKPEKQNQFTAKVLIGQKDSLNAYLIDIEAELKNYEDSAEIENITDLVRGCYNDMDRTRMIELYEYSINNDTVFIDCSCRFPRYVLIYQPSYHVAYTADSIKDFLLPEIYQQLISNRGKK